MSTNHPFMGKAEKTRRYIIEKTAPVFNQKGFAGTALQDLTNATGLTKGSIYGNFKNKDEVALEVFDYNFEQFRQGVRQLMQDHRNNVEKLLCYPRYYRNTSSDILRNGGCPILNTGTEADDTHPALQDKAAEAIDNWKKSLVGIIDIGKYKGEIKKDIDSEKYGRLIISLIEGGLFLAKVADDMYYLHQSLDEIEKIILTELKQK